MRNRTRLLAPTSVLITMIGAIVFSGWPQLSSGQSDFYLYQLEVHCIPRAAAVIFTVQGTGMMGTKQVCAGKCDGGIVTLDEAFAKFPAGVSATLRTQVENAPAGKVGCVAGGPDDKKPPEDKKPKCEPPSKGMEVDPDPTGEYGSFVPVPGQTLKFTASVPSGTARFRFELDPEGTSHFPGYATNADIDDAFFLKYDVLSLEGQYKNDGPDVLFDPSRFANREEWSRVEPLVVETAKPQSAAVVTVTTMDYGAVGSLRAFVKSEECGDWQPVPMRLGNETREAIAIPMDEDHNLMADALEDYRGLDPGADDDAEPKGNGMAGDGLTAFEEYRGFLISSGDCGTWYVDGHVRTKPKVKDVFVHTPDPELEMTLPHFAWASGVETHAICETQYSGNPQIDWDSAYGQQAGDLGTHSTDRMRIVNFTLQFARLREWRGQKLTQDVPQHGLYLVNRTLDENSGRTCFDDPPRCTGTELGPPMKTSVLIVDKSQSQENILARVSGPTHELGHAVGMPHHGWKVQNWKGEIIRSNHTNLDETPNVVPPGADCIDPGTQPASDDFVGAYYRGAFVGCAAGQIIVQNGENSGNAECPMRYSFGRDFREAPGSRQSAFVRTEVDEVLQNNQRRPARDRFGDPRQVFLWRGRFLKYDNSLDHYALGRFCPVNTGTGLNGLPGDQNQAGDSQVACMDQLVVNDNVLRGIR
jgi:hypothetical protein